MFGAETELIRREGRCRYLAWSSSHGVQLAFRDTGDYIYQNWLRENRVYYLVYHPPVCAIYLVARELGGAGGTRSPSGVA